MVYLEFRFAIVFLSAVKAGFISFWASFSRKALKIREITIFKGNRRKGYGNPVCIVGKHAIGSVSGKGNPPVDSTAAHLHVWSAG